MFYDINSATATDWKHIQCLSESAIALQQNYFSK